MTKYELVVVLEVNRPEEQITQSLEKIQDVITRNGATMDSRESWGKRRLAYPINRRRDGHYTMFLFDAEPTSPALAELNRHLRISEDVLRFLVTKAVVGKSRGNPPAEGQDFGYQSRPRFDRRDRGDRGGPRGDRGDRGPRMDRGDRGDRGERTAAPAPDAAAAAPTAES